MGNFNIYVFGRGGFGRRGWEGVVRGMRRT